MTKITTYAEIEKISRTAKNLKGDWEVRCLGLPMTRRYTSRAAIAAAKQLQEQVEAEVTVHWVG